MSRPRGDIGLCRVYLRTAWHQNESQLKRLDALDVAGFITGRRRRTDATPKHMQQMLACPCRRWTDIRPITTYRKTSWYPTQKPFFAFGAASSNLAATRCRRARCFCGCGSALVAAQKLKSSGLHPMFHRQLFEPQCPSQHADNKGNLVVD